MKFSLANKFSPKGDRGLDLLVLVSTDVSWFCPTILCRRSGGTDCTCELQNTDSIRNSTEQKLRYLTNAHGGMLTDVV